MIYQRSFFAMGCHMLAALDSDSPRAERRLAQVPIWFEVWENCLSRFRENSELNRINRMSGTPVPVSETMWAVLQSAETAWQQSQGLVTPLLLGALESAGYRRSFESMQSEEIEGKEASSTERAWRFGDIERDESRRTIRLQPGMRLDFGGIAKGWAANEVVKRLQNYGPVLINAGGDIAISSLQVGGQAWEVGITDPYDPKKHVVVVHLGRSGIATSGRDYRRWQKRGVWQHHIIDPRTLRPAETDVIAASIIAPEVRQAEMAAKVLLLLGKQAGKEWLETQKNLSGLWIDQDGHVEYSREFEKYLGENHVKHNAFGFRI